MLTSASEKAQQKIESNNFGIRKNLLEYDQVNNDQREIIYSERAKVLNGENMRDSIFKMIQDQVEKTVDTCISSEIPKEDWNLNELNELLLPVIPMSRVKEADIETVKNEKELKQYLKEQAVLLYEAKETEFPEVEQFRELERVVLLKVIDRKWMDHIDDMDQLRQGIGLQACLAGGAELSLMGREIFHQGRAIARTALGTADGVDVQLDVGQTQLTEQGIGYGNAGGVSGRRFGAVELGTELVELTGTAGLGCLTAEAADDIEELEGHGIRAAAVLDDGTGDGCGTLGTQGDGTALVAAVKEGVHLLLYHVGGVADTAAEKLGCFKGGGADLVKAVAGGNGTGGLLNESPGGNFLGHNIKGALNLLNHGSILSMQ